jgi:hypothetical protein
MSLKSFRTSSYSKKRVLQKWNPLVRSAALQFSVAGCISVISDVVAPTAIYSQVLLPSNVPTLFQPQVGTGTSTFAIDSSVNCPTTTLNVSGFGGNLNAWGDTHYSPFQSTSGGVGNYGIAAGVSVPLSRTLTNYCRKYAEEKIKFQETLTRNQAINSQFSFFQHCKYFRDLGYTLLEPEFQKEPLLVFSKCYELAKLVDPSARKYPRSPMATGELTPPKPASTDSSSPQPLLLITQPSR